MGIIEDWGLKIEELNEILSTRPSIRGMLSGFIAEYKLSKQWFSDSRIHAVKRYDNHDRKRLGDFGFMYRGLSYTIEVKSLQTNSVRATDNGFHGTVQIDASDKRKITLPNGEELATTCLIAGGFDVLAVNLFEFERKWTFAFAWNEELPRSTFKGYTDSQRKYLLSTSAKVRWPLEPPFTADPFRLLNRIAASRKRKG
jgi:hypothetical protein